MKQLIKIFFAVIISGLCLVSNTNANEPPVLSAGISLNEQVPIDLMGTWRVVSKLNKTNALGTFKPQGVDIWNLFKSGDVINLSNPLSGAKAAVRVEFVKNNTVKFSKEGIYDGQKLCDTVEITVQGDKFTGKNYLNLTTSDGVVRSAEFILKGDKIFGQSIDSD